MHWVSVDFYWYPSKKRASIIFHKHARIDKGRKAGGVKIANLKDKDYGKQIITYGHYCLKILTYIKLNINNQILYRPFKKINRVILFSIDLFREIHYNSRYKH